MGASDLTAFEKAFSASHEFEGKSTSIRPELPRRAESAVVTNLMEKRGAALAIGASGRDVVVHTGPREIKTVEVTFAGS